MPFLVAKDVPPPAEEGKRGVDKGKNIQVSYTEILALDVQKRPATLSRHRPFHQTQDRWAPSQIEDPLFVTGNRGPGCNDRGEKSGRTRARP